jgi:hypothetical protein
MAPRVVTAPAPAATQAALGKRCGHARLSALCAALCRLSHARKALVHLPRGAIIQQSNTCAPTHRSSRPAPGCALRGRLTSNVRPHEDRLQCMVGRMFFVNAAQPSVTAFTLPSAPVAHPLASGAPSAYCGAEGLCSLGRLCVSRRPAHGRSRAKATCLGAWSSFGVLAQAKSRAPKLSRPRHRHCAASHCHPQRGVLAWWEHTASVLARNAVQLTPENPPFYRHRNIAIVASCAAASCAIATPAR